MLEHNGIYLILRQNRPEGTEIMMMQDREIQMITGH